MAQSALRCSRIALVPLPEEHFEHEIALDSDPAVMRYLGDGTASTRQQVERAHRRRIAAKSNA